MDGYDFCTNYLEIVTGTTNKTSPVYREAAKNIDENNDKAMKQMKNFIVSIERLAGTGEVSDERISSTQGNIEEFSGYNDIKVVIDFLQKNLYGIDVVKSAVSLHNSLLQYKDRYMEGYRKNVRLVILEYESGLYLLVTGLVGIMSTNIECIQDGTSIKIKKKFGKTLGVIPKMLNSFSLELTNKDHLTYLDTVIKEKDNVPINSSSIGESVSFMENSVTDTLGLIANIWNNARKLLSKGSNLFKTAKRTLFGIVPLIRSVIYLHYKRKSDKIANLEQQARFIQMNIEQLQNIKNMDPEKKAEIIKRQRSYVDAYMKKAEKMRAELIEEEKDTVQALNEDDKTIGDTSNSDDEFVLEGKTFLEGM